MASIKELDAIELELRRELALRSPLEYATYHNGEFLSPPHVQLLADCVTRLVEGRLLKEDGTPYNRLMVNMPPRHGKSELITRATPAWFLTKYPSKRVIVTGYEADFAADFGADARRYIEAHPELGVQLDPSTSAKDNWGILQNTGGMKTAGAGGAITGKGAHLFVIDDPVKSAEDADSITVREKHWKWWQGTIIPRREPGCVIIMVMTRWHEDDLAGRCLQAEPDEWFQLSLPAIADHTEGIDVIGRAPGEALWPQRYPIQELEVIRGGMGNRWWSAEYQQKPTIDGGNMFKPSTFREYVPVQTANGTIFRYTTPSGTLKEVRSDQIWRFTSLDLAATEKTAADFTVGSVWGVTPDRELLLLAVHRERMQSADHLSFVQRLHQVYNPRFHAVEKATYGLTLIQHMRRVGVPVFECKADKDKVARAWPAVGYIENGALYFPRTAAWLADLVIEMEQFPHGAHDDMVDTVAYAARVLTDRVRPDARVKEVEEVLPNQISVDRILKNKKKQQRIKSSNNGMW